MMDFFRREISVKVVSGNVTGTAAAVVEMVVAGTKDVYTLALMVDAVPATIAVGVSDDVELKLGHGTVEFMPPPPPFGGFQNDIRQRPRVLYCDLSR